MSHAWCSYKHRRSMLRRNTSFTGKQYVSRERRSGTVFPGAIFMRAPPAPAAVTAARLMGGMRVVHVRRVTLLLAGETAPRRARVRAAAAAAAANSGPTGLLQGLL